MPIITDWYDKQENIILQQYVGNWTVEETQQGNDEIHQLFDEVNNRFDIISDYSKAHYTLPIGTLFAWEAMVTKRDIKYPNWGLSVFVITSPVYQAYFEAGIAESKIIRQHCRLVGTVDEAVQLIMEDRQSATKNAITP